MSNSPPMFAICGTGLGDVWTSVSHAIRHCPHREIRIARAFRSYDRGPLLEEVVKLMEGGELVKVWDHSSDMSYVTAYQHEPVPVRPEFRWRRVEGARLCHQLNGVSQAELKSCTDEEVARFECQYVSDRLGLPRTLTECVRLLSRCSTFVGIDSGYTHVNYSVGAPAILIKNQSNQDMMDRHEGKPALWVSSIDDARALL